MAVVLSVTHPYPTKASPTMAMTRLRMRRMPTLNLLQHLAHFPCSRVRDLDLDLERDLERGMLQVVVSLPQFVAVARRWECKVLGGRALCPHKQPCSSWCFNGMSQRVVEGTTKSDKAWGTLTWLAEHTTKEKVVLFRELWQRRPLVITHSYHQNIKASRNTSLYFNLSRCKLFT